MQRWPRCNTSGGRDLRDGIRGAGLSAVAMPLRRWHDDGMVISAEGRAAVPAMQPITARAYEALHPPATDGARRYLAVEVERFPIVPPPSLPARRISPRVEPTAIATRGARGGQR